MLTHKDTQAQSRTKVRKLNTDNQLFVKSVFVYLCVLSAFAVP